MEIKNVDINRLKAGYNPRKNFNFEDLQRSIEKEGILIPLLVRPIDNKYEIIAGECRWRSGLNLKLEKVPCIIRELSDESASNLAFIDNDQRNNLSVLEKAKHFRYMRDKHDYTVRDMEEKYNIDKAQISRYLKISKIGSNSVEPVQQLDMMQLYYISRLIDEEKLIVCYEKGFQTTKNNWSDEHNAIFSEELNYRKEEQRKIILLCTAEEWTKKETERSVKDKLYLFNERDNHIEKIQEDKVNDVVGKIRKGISSLADALSSYNRDIDGFYNVGTMFNDKFIGIIPEREKNQIKADLGDMKERLIKFDKDKLLNEVIAMEKKFNR
jgi:ParB/RepB/Spo0J family partition protein